MASPQLTFSFAVPDRTDFEHFVPGPNSAVVESLRQAAERPSDIWPLVWGPPESGKTHLLVAASRLATERGRRAIYVASGELASFGPDALEAMEGNELVCLDEIDCLFGDTDWEEALFHRFNRLRRNGCCLIMSASVAPASFTIGLPDLRSRLNWGTTHALFPLDDTSRRELVVLRGERHGIRLESDVVDYLLNRAPRGVAQLSGLVDLLAERCFAEKRRVTVPLARSLLQSNDAQQGVSE